MYAHLATSKRFILVLGLLTGLVAFAIDISLPSIPPMVTDLATTIARGQQVVGAFMAGLALGQMPAGLLSDRYGRIPVLYTGIAIFALTGVVTTIAPDIETMLVARFVQGIGAASGLVLARAIVRDVASGTQAARMMTALVMIFTAAPMLAPMFGSFLTTQLGWRAPYLAVTVVAVALLYGINAVLEETNPDGRKDQLSEQFATSIRSFFSRAQCVFGVLVVLSTMIGIMAIVSGSPGLIVDVYGYPVGSFGYIFALTGVAILCGSYLNRRLLQRFSPQQALGLGAALCLACGAQLAWFLASAETNFWWLWANACLFMGATGFIMPNATAIALEPVPHIAGVAASIIGTIQSIAGAVSAIVCAALYDGTFENVALVLCVSTALIVVLIALRPAAAVSPAR